MPKKEIVARRVFHNGKWRWRVIIPMELNGGKQKRRYFKTQEKAEAEATLLQSARENSTRAFLRLSPALQATILHALEMLQGRESEIVDAVRVYLHSNTKEQRTLGDAIDDCLAAKKASGCRHRYLVALANTLKRFSLGKESNFVHESTVRECDTWINSEGTRGKTPAVPWQQDGLRHTFVSNHYALHGEIETAQQAGHSEAMLHQHYRAIVTKTAAENFWALRPEKE